MSIFGKILGEVIGGVVDTVRISESLITDTVKSPIRIMDKLIDGDGESLLEDTQATIREIKED